MGHITRVAVRSSCVWILCVTEPSEGRGRESLLPALLAPSHFSSALAHYWGRMENMGFCIHIIMALKAE